MDGKIRLLDPATCDPVASVKNDTKYVISVAFSPDGKRLLTTGQDAVKMWSVAELLKRKPK
jgi:WD40 repeat protein